MAIDSQNAPKGWESEGLEYRLDVEVRDKGGGCFAHSLHRDERLFLISHSCIPLQRHLSGRHIRQFGGILKAPEYVVCRCILMMKSPLDLPPQRTRHCTVRCIAEAPSTRAPDYRHALDPEEFDHGLRRLARKQHSKPRRTHVIALIVQELAERRTECWSIDASLCFN